MTIYKGGTEIEQIYLGGNRVYAVHRGDQLVFPNFAINDSGLIVRMVAPATSGTFDDPYASASRDWTSNGTHVTGPFGSRDTDWLGYGIEMTAAIDSLYRLQGAELTNNVTFSWWAKQDLGAAEGHISTNCNDGNTHGGYEFNTAARGGTWTASTGDGTGGASTDRTTKEYASMPDMRGMGWVHYTQKYTGINAGNMTVNGTVYTPTSTSGSSSAIDRIVTASDWQCNSVWHPYTPVAWGAIADLRVYNRLLSTNEINSIRRGES